jgi:hypothetical protein
MWSGIPAFYLGVPWPKGKKTPTPQATIVIQVVIEGRKVAGEATHITLKSPMANRMAKRTWTLREAPITMLPVPRSR